MNRATLASDRIEPVGIEGRCDNRYTGSGIRPFGRGMLDGQRRFEPQYKHEAQASE